MTTPAAGRPAVRVSVVIPTYQRREVVARAVQALSQQQDPPPFEVLVVVDGSTDGTAAALRQLSVLFPFQVVEQANNGAAAARNAGAALASGELVLFLDDDMMAGPDLLRVHDERHRAGADAVLGDIPLHPDSPAWFMAAGVGAWAAERADRLASAPDLQLADLLTGQLSVRRDLFARLGGFESSYTSGGTFGGEDIDFGIRLLSSGARVVYEPRAVSHQLYVVTPERYLTQWHQAGRSAVALARRHPAHAEESFAGHRPRSRWNRSVSRPLAAVPGLRVAAALAARRAALALATRDDDRDRARRWFKRARDLEVWRGVAEAGGMPRPRRLSVLAYHCASDLRPDPLIGEYGVPASDLARQLALLARTGHHFVDAAEVERALTQGTGLPHRPVFVTFDDGAADLLPEALPVLAAARAPATVFAIAARLGSENVWDQELGAGPVQLADAGELRELAAGGVDIGAHSAHHRQLVGLADDELEAETAGAAELLEQAGLPRPRLFAYPYGVHDERVHRAVEQAGYAAAFTVTPGRAPVGVDRWQVPRIEVLRSDGTGLRFLLKVVSGGRLATDVTVRRAARKRARRVLRHVPAALRAGLRR